MSQGSLFPLRVRHHLPPRGVGKDLRFEAVAEDGMEWALKRQAEHPMLPATEFLCYRIAEACALATPHSAILADLDGAAVFGSRIEAGLTEFAAYPPPEVPQRLHACAGRISACYAFDLFVGNEDRHFGNFLFRERRDGTLAVLPIDYSRAWWVKGWPPPAVVGRPCKTTTHIDILRGMNRWVAAEAQLTLGTISSIPVAAIERWAEDMPAQWLTPPDLEALVSWWASDPFYERISACVQHCR